MSEQEKPPPPQIGDDIFDMEKAAHRTYAVIHMLAAITLPFRRYRGGRDVDGRVLALAALAFWAFFCQSQACLNYLYFWLAAMVAFALTTTRSCHSKFEGKPYMMLLVGRYWPAVVLEIVAILALGMAIHPVIPPLGVLLLASGAGCFADQVTGWWTRRKRLLQYLDAQHEIRNQQAAYRRAR